MADDLTKRTLRDYPGISVNEEWELDYWTRVFAVRKDQVKEALGTVGVRVDDVRRHLATRQRIV